MVRHTVKTGDVFLYNDEKQHRYFVVGQDNKNSNKILCVIATSQCDKRRKYAAEKNLYSSDSVVSVNPSEYKSEIHHQKCSLTKQTCFDCNDVQIMYWNQMRSSKKMCSPMNREVLNKLHQAIRSSPITEEDVLNLL